MSSGQPTKSELLRIAGSDEYDDFTFSLLHDDEEGKQLINALQDTDHKMDEIYKEIQVLESRLMPLRANQRSLRAMQRDLFIRMEIKQSTLFENALKQVKD